MKPHEIELRVIAADKKLIEMTCSDMNDFLNGYSKELHIIVPFDYKKNGCKVFGGKWIDIKSIELQHQHFNGKRTDGNYLFCTGVPDSFLEMKNVILENVRTADKMLTAYELYQKGLTNGLELLAYSHGEEGVDEYKKRKKRVPTRKS